MPPLRPAVDVIPCHFSGLTARATRKTLTGWKTIMEELREKFDRIKARRVSLEGYL